jgi:hypothetical protein
MIVIAIADWWWGVLAAMVAGSGWPGCCSPAQTQAAGTEIRVRAILAGSRDARDRFQVQPKYSLSTAKRGDTRKR